MNQIEFTLAFASKVGTTEVDPSIIEYHYKKFIKAGTTISDYFHQETISKEELRFIPKELLSDKIGANMNYDTLYYQVGMAADDIVCIEIDMVKGCYRFTSETTIYEHKDLDKVLEAMNIEYLSMI